jgi:hypothetical protein
VVNVLVLKNQQLREESSDNKKGCYIALAVIPSKFTTYIAPAG